MKNCKYPASQNLIQSHFVRLFFISEDWHLPNRCRLAGQDEVTVWGRQTRRRWMDELWMLQEQSILLDLIMKLTVTDIVVRVATSDGMSFWASFG